jgi:hypothetical protein
MRPKDNKSGDLATARLRALLPGSRLSPHDLLLPGALAYVANYFSRHSDIDVVYGNRILIDENDHEIGMWVLPGHDDRALTLTDYVPQETLFWRRTVWEAIGGARHQLSVRAGLGPPAAHAGGRGVGSRTCLASSAHSESMSSRSRRRRCPSEGRVRATTPASAQPEHVPG